MPNVRLDGNVYDQNDVPVTGALAFIFDGQGLASLFDAMDQPIENPIVTGEDGYWEAWVETDRVYTYKYFFGGRLRRIDANIIAGEPPLDFNMDPNLRPDLSSTDPGKGAALSGYDDTNDYADETTGLRLNILSATMRPAMRGIFSGDEDQRAALLAFINEAAERGKTIEWWNWDGPVDVSLDVATATGVVRGLGVPSGSRWVMHPDTIIRALPNDASNYEIINLRNVSDVVIEGCGARLIGERDEHTGVTGEFGMGLSIRGSTNIAVRDLTISDCWGDGVYVGTTAEQAFSQDVLLERLRVTNARRNGFSLISAKSLHCLDGLFELTNGTNPQYGVDIEPNDPSEFLQDIVFQRNTTRSNATIGIGVALNNLNGTANPVDIRIIDHRDDGSTSAIYGAIDANVPGTVQIIRPLSLNATGAGITLRNKRASGPRWRIVDPTIINWNRTNSSGSTLSSGILIYAPSGDAGTGAQGNVDIIGANLRLTDVNNAVNAIAVSEARTTTPDQPQDIRILAPADLASRPCQVVGVKTFTDPNRVSVRELSETGTINLTRANAFAHYRLPSKGSSQAINIDNNQAIGLEMTFELTGVGAGQSRIGLPAGVNIAPDAITDDTGYIYGTQKGCRLTLRKHSATEWFVKEKVGTWTTA